MSDSLQMLIDFTDDAQSESSVQDFLQPLRETAERVSQQVEDFASRLHRFKTGRVTDSEELWTDAWALLDDYRALSTKRLANTSSTSRAFSHRKSLGDSNAQTQKLQLEADIWALTKNLLLSYAPRAKTEASEAAATTFSEIHRYSTNHQIWNSFLDSDTTAQEYETILAWLHERADQTSPTIDEIVHNLTIEAERGDGFWSAGPLFTKAAIKKQKRDRAWPLPLDPSNPGLIASHRRQDDQSLVTQLDPDSVTRENAHLEPQDEAYEQAAWITCWELLRRGKPLSDVRAWWDERNEQWRSLLLRSGAPSTADSVKSPWLRMMNLASNGDWLARCNELATGNAIQDPFQQAVYALLAGNSAISNKVCESVDEYTFSEFNAFLIHRFQQYVRQYRETSAASSGKTYQIAPREATGKLVHSLQSNPLFREELHEPHKLTQLALMGQDFGNFFVLIGRAAAQIANVDGGSGFKKLIAPDKGSPVSPSAVVTAQDEDCVRVVVHLQLALQSLGLLDASWKSNKSELENNIVNYIGWLQKDQKWSLLPIYASKLSSERTRQVLGEILIEVTNDKDRDAQVRLLKKYGIDVPDVVYGIESLGTFHAANRFKNSGFITAPRITERVGTGNSGQTKIRSMFMGEDFISPEEDKLVSCVEWSRFVDAASWGKPCFHISLLYKLWLFEGRFSALSHLANTCALAHVSLSALGQNLTFADDSQDELDELDMNGDQGIKTESEEIHPYARNATTRSQLYEQSLNWLQLEQLTRALAALEKWQDIADEVEK